MVLVYVDDILIFAKDPKVTMDELGKMYELKPESVHEPYIYLGADMEMVQLPNGKVEWAIMGSKTYVKNAVKVVEALIAECNPEAKLKTTARNPFPSGYKPELDVKPELNDELGSRFLQLIGILRWAIELGRMDIFVEVSQLSQHQALPRHGHLEALYHIFAYLKKHENDTRIVFDPKTPNIDKRVFNSDADSQDFYGDVREELPPNMPEPKGKSVLISCFVDANHAGNVITRRCTLGSLSMCRTHQLFGSQSVRIRSRLLALAASLLPSELRRICSLHCVINCECLAFRLTDQPMYFVTTMASSRIQQFQSECLRKSIMQLTTTLFVRRLPPRYCEWARRME
jgi:hypothetical protein